MVQAIMSIRAVVCTLMTIFTFLFAGPAAAQQGLLEGGPHIGMRLVAETGRPAPGSEVTIAFSSVPQPGWHAYWKNGGDAGLETQLTWALPKGVTAGAMRYPVPGRLLISGLMNYVYEAPFATFVTLKIPPGPAAGSALPINVKVDYLVCTTTICVPETQTLSTTLIVGDGVIDPAVRARFDAWRRAFPRPLDAVATYQIEKGRFRLAVPYPASAQAPDAYFYPAASGAIDYAAPQSMSRNGDVLLIETKAAADPAQGPIKGVLATGKGSGLAIKAAPGTVIAGANGPGFEWRVALLAFAGALAGGLILNVMPCVFPILSLKALSLAKGNTDAGQARREALAYTGGVVLVCLGLGGGLLALRAAGASAGWAFQLQDPRVIGVLLLLVSTIALNLAGLFELPTPRFAGESGAIGAFATGALAAFVATPCTGPFMGAALGAALVLPAAAALLVFAGLGLGIALPFLALGFIPALRRLLPKPGAWMERLRRILSVPMFLTALALAWILGRQAGVDGMTIGLALTMLAGIGLWWTGRLQIAGRSRAGWPAVAAFALAIGGAMWLKPQPVAAPASAAGEQVFSEEKLAAMRAANRPVFAYFTADWCLTCKVNEKGAIERAAVQAAFAKHNVAVLVGDWTNGDPVLGRFIEQHNRAGVPLYLYYAPGMAEPVVLPQVLTPSMLEALGR